MNAVIVTYNDEFMDGPWTKEAIDKEFLTNDNYTLTIIDLDRKMIRALNQLDFTYDDQRSEILHALVKYYSDDVVDVRDVFVDEDDPKEVYNWVMEYLG